MKDRHAESVSIYQVPPGDRRGYGVHWKVAPVESGPEPGRPLLDRLEMGLVWTQAIRDRVMHIRGNRGGTRPAHPLTVSDKETVRKLLGKKSIRQIARHLGATRPTVSRYVALVLQEHIDAALD